MDPKEPIPQPAPDLTFQVMPSDQAHPEKNVNPIQMPVPPTPARNSSNGTPDVAMPPEPSNSGGSRKFLWIGGSIVILGLIGFGLYYFLGMKDTPTTPPVQQSTQSIRLPKVWLNQYFNNETCTDQSICGEAADPDQDGLTNYDEFKTSTSPIDPDTDKDGLADGDEVHVFKTEPTLKYTDRRDVVSQNDWHDAYQIKSGYDPLTPGMKMTDSRIQQIADDTKSNPLHQPTIATLAAAATPTPPASAQKTVTVNIENNKFNPATINISKGDTVVWLNKDVAPHHVASDPHPSHTGLPGLESADLSTNQTFSFTFTQVGSFGYHDHLNPSIKGTVVVK